MRKERGRHTIDSRSDGDFNAVNGVLWGVLDSLCLARLVERDEGNSCQCLGELFLFDTTGDP